MRELNDFEKDILRRIIHFHNNGIILDFASALDHRLVDKAIYMDYRNFSVEIQADAALYTEGILIEQVRTLTAEIVVMVNLLKDLEDHGYLSLFLETGLPPTFRYGQLVHGNEYITAPIYDPNIKDKLLDYSLKSILVGQPLIEFVNNKFLTNAQVRDNQSKAQMITDSRTNKRNLYIAVVALVISTLLSISQIYGNKHEAKHKKRPCRQECISPSDSLSHAEHAN